MNLIGVAENAFGSLKQQRLRSLYQSDFVAWRADVLGFRSYEKMDAICQDALFGEKNRTAIKSSNGTSKTHEIANMVGWVGSVFEPGETLSIITAPSLPQVERGVFRYLKTVRERAAERGHPMPGWTNEQVEWLYKGPEGNVPLAFGRTPAKGSEVSTFQGIRSQTGRTYVFADEAGGLSTNTFTAIEAVLTGEQSRGVFIGNPDDIGTEWERIFKDRRYANKFSLHSISSFELPTLTGEMVYPDDPAMQERLMQALTQRSWVEDKREIWGEKDPRYVSKVLGEFPDQGGFGFFGMSSINKAFNTEIPYDSDAPGVLGVDIARFGDDESVVYENKGGRIRLREAWGKLDTVDSARKVHDWGIRTGAVEVRIDAQGVGGGVYDQLERLPEFADKTYRLIGIDGKGKTPDVAQWADIKAYNHECLRRLMLSEEVDFDLEDDELKDQLTNLTFKFTDRGGVRITPKSEMKSIFKGSPDRLDAVVYSTVDVSWFTGSDLNQRTPGEVVVVDPSDFVDMPQWGDRGHVM